MKQADVTGVIEKLIRVEFPDAVAAFIGGSAINGGFNEYSDIDTIILRPSVSSGSRQVFCIDDITIEAFVQDEETLPWFFESDRTRGRPVLLRLAAEGIIVGSDQALAGKYQQLARQILTQGPAPLTQEVIDQLRYVITDRLNDLRVHRESSELTALASELYPLLAELLLRGRGQWFGAGKWIPRLLRQFNQYLYEDFSQAFNELFRKGDASLIITLAERELASFGGLLLVGTKQFAPPENRYKL